MVATLYKQTDVIPSTNPPVLFYGQPGAGKTSAGQTGVDALTLDFDGGAHRSEFRKDTLRIESWADMLDQMVVDEIAAHQTIVVDTVGTCLEFMAACIDGKGMRNQGGLSLQGFGVLKNMFNQWVGLLRTTGKQLVFIAHEKAGKDDEPLRPDITGGSYAIVMNKADIVGYIEYRSGRRQIGFEPTDRYFAKNGAQLKSGPIPDFHKNPNFLADLLAEAKRNLGRVSEQSAALVKQVEEWHKRLAEIESVDQINGWLADMAKMKLVEPAKSQAWALTKQCAADNEWTYDAKAKCFRPMDVQGGAA